jgi:hypothetical protein
LSVWDDRIAVQSSKAAMEKFRELTKGVEEIQLSVGSYFPEYP